MTGPCDLVELKVRFAGKFESSAVTGRVERVGGYLRFCERTGVVPFPVTESSLLGHLEAKMPGVSWRYVKSIIRALVDWHELEGEPVPWRNAADRFLAAAKRDADAPDPVVMSRLHGHEVREVVRLLRGSTTLDPELSSPEVVALRGVVDAVCAGASCAAAVRAHNAGSAVALKPTSVPGIIGRARSRAGIPRAVPLGELCPEDVARLKRHLDRNHERNVRDAAYFLVGITGALRHISLANLCLEDVVADGHRYVLTIRKAKLRKGEVLVQDVPHLGVGGDPCDPLACAACALGAQLAMCANRGRTDGPVFATWYGGQQRRMTTANGRNRLSHIIRQVAPEMDQRSVGTRSLRITGATLAAEAGVPLSVVQQLTHHTDEAVLRGYLQVDESLLRVRPNFS